jgi:tRNA dimethylallyltransferase
VQARIDTAFNCIAVVGPTASGKTKLAATLAYELNGEVISADSRQVYKGLDIGTGKDLDQYVVKGKAIPYHLIGIVDASTQYYLHDFVSDLRRCFDDISSRGKLPVICGGSGLYLDALRKNFEVTQVPENEALRATLGDLSKVELLEKLSQYPAEHVARVDRTSVKRIIRGIEVADFLSRNSLKVQSPLPYRPYYLGILSSKEKIAERIRTRLDERLEHGLIDEVKNLSGAGLSFERLQTLGLEYKFVSLYLNGELTFEKMKESLYTAIRQFSKRQMTWFRKMEKEGVKIRWLEDPLNLEFVTQEVKELFTGR